MSRAQRLWAKYEVDSSDIQKAAWEIAQGQSVGNPYKHSLLETPQLIAKHRASFKVRGREISVGYPLCNFGRHDGINYLLSVLMGGQMDIDNIRGCILKELDLGTYETRYPKPRFGIEKTRDALKAYDRPLLCGIFKPKIGLSPNQMADLAREMAEGGCDILKEDEILSDPYWAPLRQRVPAIMKATKDLNTLYMPCITSDGRETLRRAKYCEDQGVQIVHLNIWSGLGAYKEIRESTQLGIWFQKSGDKVWTTGKYSIDYAVICKLVNLIGCDFAHVGMYGGYMADTIGDLQRRITALGNTWPSFSCGATPELVPTLMQKFGNDIVITSGGAIHSNPKGPRAGAKAFRDAMK